MSSVDPVRSPERPRRVALVLARYSAGGGTPPGIDRDTFARTCLADTYEVLADLVGVTAGIVGPAETQDLLWGDGLWRPDQPVLTLAASLAADFDELVCVTADVPDLPGLVLAKMFKVLHRVDLTFAPARNGPGCAAVGLALPAAAWVPEPDLDASRDALVAAAPSRNRCVLSPDWHRLQTAEAVNRLDPRLEGWEETRALLSGHPLAGV
ncbi:MAG TPA: hypothetical protein VIT20_11650 [Propionibacteriaceae bacterium]